VTRHRYRVGSVTVLSPHVENQQPQLVPANLSLDSKKNPVLE
jgi:hypothetical protein